MTSPPPDPSIETMPDELVAIALDLAARGQTEPARRLLTLAKELQQPREFQPDQGHETGELECQELSGDRQTLTGAPNKTAPIQVRGKESSASETARLEIQVSAPGQSRGDRTTLTIENPLTLESAQRETEAETINDDKAASHLIGLAELYEQRGQISTALESLQIAKARGPHLPGAFKQHGVMLFQAKDYRAATRELEKAFENNPFDAEVAELLGRIRLERGNRETALAHTVDAFLLLGNEYSPAGSRVRRRIRTLKKILRWTNSELIELFHQRQALLTAAFEKLDWRQDLEIQEEHLLSAPQPPPEPEDSGARMELAARLRRIEIWTPLADEILYKIAKMVSEENYATRTRLFDFKSESRDIYFLESGELSALRPTPYGELEMMSISAGSLMGEINFVAPAGRSAAIETVGRSRLLRIDAAGLDELVDANPDFGVQLYSSLWHSLAQKLRSSNDRLTDFFQSSGASQGSLTRENSGSLNLRGSNTPEVEFEEKMRVFREQGLTHKEIRTLATFSRELQFREGSYLFREGDAGDEMFIVLDGAIRISKFIPGGGEEALEIVERGGFFGEISLIDGQPRSADAQAHAGQATVLALDQRTVREVLSLDPQASLDFLKLLCRLVASRLRELDEKLVLWKILQGPEQLKTMA